ncbi:MAG: hypothetical protein KDD46_07795 [Bdellovibrionales bacterium]|nr:hypothetical protein [Bdellovibrionales bacterium]
MKKILLVLVCGLVFSVEAFASTTTPLLSSREYTVGQGDIELSFFMNPRFSKFGGANSDSFSFNLGANYFWTDVLAPGFEFGFTSGTVDSFRLVPNIKAYLPTQSRFLPFMKAGIGYARQFSENYLAIVLSPGVNYMISNTVAFGAQLNYELGVASQNYHVFEIPFQFALYFRY